MIMPHNMFDVLSIMLQQYMYVCIYVHVHGARSPDDLTYSSILFDGRRVGDIIVWYQSSGYSMVLKGP